ncbi:MAG: hypothetical protein EBR82_32085 [Caulobacteraceae bacterium]|nr:hypothetical protein [Caulobacteraceae bacterium]
MNPEKQRIAIAEACGWVAKTEQVEHTDGYQWTETRKFWVSQHGKRGELPDYFHDLNAMHEAEKVLRPMQRGQYRTELVYVLAGADIFATAEQRAEAFLRAIGKWEDDK